MFIKLAMLRHTRTRHKTLIADSSKLTASLDTNGSNSGCTSLRRNPFITCATIEQTAIIFKEDTNPGPSNTKKGALPCAPDENQNPAFSQS
jgi:hypothetical protein